MGVGEQNPETPSGQKLSQSDSSQHAPPCPNPQDDASPRKQPQTPKDFILSVASKLTSQPLTNPDPNVWGVLTAISSHARKRAQGINIVLTGEEHCIGRLVEDMRFQVEANAVSGNHCKIFRKNAVAELSDVTVFLKDTSTNGTYLNWKKLTKSSPEAKVQHGDIISFAAPPQHELAVAFVYREVVRSNSSMEGAVAKRKAEDIVGENKRMKGIGIGAPEGPISLDDFRILQRSNKELRKQLENQVLTIDTLRNEQQNTIDRHENEIKEMKESVAKSYLDHIKELQNMLDAKQKELVEVNRISAEQKHVLEDLNERLTASRLSCNEANEVMKSQKASIAELEAQLEEERDQRKEERQKATSDLKAAVQRVQSEALEEIKRLSNAALQQERELQEEINKLQEKEKKWCSQVETLMPKLEETRQKLVASDNKIRQLEAQVCEEQLASANGRKRVDELEQEMYRLRKELENEKAAREEAWAKVSTLELEINAAMRDLEFERRRLKGARERIMLRETQLRAFYSTTEEISGLFTKQQEQLKAMQRTLEDEENYDNTSVDIDLNLNPRNMDGNLVRDNGMTRYHSNSRAKAGSGPSARRFDRNQTVTSSDGASVTEKHDCDTRSQEDQDTHEEEFTSAEHHVKGGFGSEIDGVGTAPVLEGETIGTEQVLETESLGVDGERNFDLNKYSCLAGDTMQVEGEDCAHEGDERIQTILHDGLHHTQSSNLPENQRDVEDTEPGGIIRTQDLLASEGVGSWACSTAPSVHGDNEYPGSGDDNEKRGADHHDSNGQVAESQSTPSSDAVAIRRNRECRALSEMIGIVAPDLKDQFGTDVDGDCDGGKERLGSSSNSDTEACSDSNDNEECAKGGSMSDTETECSDKPVEDKNLDDAMDEDTDATQEDSQ
ncbi:PREDICTED: trichohyalin isoform X2 [Populus euphratica]|uniref:Trichohyalin isoform X2 n=1 Tax=Populus euphratica TaxID=75702 RepID=A0AAJ6XX78_POPEU|nr:PREDICTED: trichohyalin isoform X2 [Populus euphratica]